MGLLRHLLFWPYTGPKFLTEFSLRQIEGVVREELTDDSAVKAELLELQLQLELGDIDDDEYVVREAVLMQRLREIRDWRERLGMGVSGGLVRMQRDPAERTDAPAPGDTESGPSGAQQAGGSTVSGGHAEPGPEADRSPVADPRGGVDIDLNLDWE